MRQVDAKEVCFRKVSELELDPKTVNLFSTEAVAAALRRAAGFLCPCSTATLTNNVVSPLQGLAEDLETTKKAVKETLNKLIIHGDIFEYCDLDLEDDSGHIMLYAAPASFVVRENGAVILIGVESNQSVLPDDLKNRIEYTRHLRRINPFKGENLAVELKELGLVKISYGQWLKTPKQKTPEQHLFRFDNFLDAAGPSGEIPELSLLDPERPVRYYSGRWTDVHSQSGRFVARRSQAYGADIWCYVHVNKGNPELLIDFPVDGDKNQWRGCDEAWHLQMAIDAKRGEPQRFRMRKDTEAGNVIEFFSPVPMWAQRKWDAVGEPIHGSGYLFAYKFPESEISEELRFIRENLWLEEVKTTKKK